jgi:hypothetical protein
MLLNIHCAQDGLPQHYMAPNVNHTEVKKPWTRLCVSGREFLFVAPVLGLKRYPKTVFKINK